MLYDFENAPVRLKLRASERKHAVNSKSRTISPGLLCPLSHHLMRRQCGKWVRGYFSRGGELARD